MKKEMMKLSYYSLAGLIILSCSTVPNNFSTLNGRMQNAPTGHEASVKEDFSTLAKKYNFAELEKEYKSFSTKALSDSYVKRMFTKFIIETLNSVQLTRQIEFARYLKQNSDASYETSLRNMFTEIPSLYSTLTGIPAIQTKITNEPASFGNFVVNLAPYSTVPVASAATSVTSASFTANWSPVTGATSYILILDGVEITGITGTSYPVDNLQPGSNHTYKVKAINSGIPGSESNQINVAIVPNAPTASVATIIGSTSFTANWNAVSGATGYKLYIDDLLEYTGTNLTYSKTGLARGTSHSYYVKATNGTVDSASSNSISLSTLGFQTLTNFQSISTLGAIDWEYFTIGTEHYLAIANYFTGSSRNTDSKIYKWNSSTSQFDSIQSIATNGARDWEFFTIGTEHYLAIANAYNGTSYNIDSKIYKWNSSTSQFVEYQSIATNDAVDWKFFTIGTEHYLAVANNYNETSYNTDSKIYKWNSSTSQFVEYQSIATNGAVDWKFFTIGTEHYLTVANAYNGTSYNTDSKIYKWNSSTSQFVEYQSIATNDAFDFEFFTIGTEHYLAIANAYNGTSYNTDSKIYKWNSSTSQFDTTPIQLIPTNGAYDWKFFTIGTEHYLTLANAYNGSSRNIDSKIYKWNSSTSQFVEYQSIATVGGADWEYFTIGANNYLAVANYTNGTSYNIDSKIYRLD